MRRIWSKLVAETVFWVSLREKCPYWELFLSVFSRIRTEYGEITRTSPYSVRMRENTDQNNCVCSILKSILKIILELTIKDIYKGVLF